MAAILQIFHPYSTHRPGAFVCEDAFGSSELKLRSGFQGSWAFPQFSDPEEETLDQNKVFSKTLVLLLG